MPDLMPTPAFDLSSPEGQAIAALFRGCKKPLSYRM
jgi:hypothetical protein